MVAFLTNRCLVKPGRMTPKQMGMLHTKDNFRLLDKVVRTHDAIPELKSHVCLVTTVMNRKISHHTINSFDVGRFSEEMRGLRRGEQRFQLLGLAVTDFSELKTKQL